ncbi:DUF485 domain-containing protein [Luteipulveratus mongoliensis]|uniref:Clumping factor B n=1 Tax=Luteipulveratus mongoliensis TaxID=571913 RepID=A0A0K1JNG1_9MICO|nr:DUF485 domain-containing protein [Luteipulveratus mongoliensis]AKU18130.1 hypothetical protein VV02_23485 [Luteipulveratus mongoliensis]
MTPASVEPSPDEAAETYREVHESAEFEELKRRFRRFVFPMTALFLAWYFVYVLLGAYAHDFMSHKLFGNITTGLVFGLLQFVSTFAITLLYVRWANRVFDPAAEALAARVKGSDA